MQRKPGAYRKPTDQQRLSSRIPKDQFDWWFAQIWNITGESTRKHPAPYPFELADRLVRMFSFVGDVVLDPFCGTGTTMLAAALAGRNSIGIEIDTRYCEIIVERMQEKNLFNDFSFNYVSCDENTIYRDMNCFYEKIS
jgi:site-specific DNA-methyltransferase (adenine-specific)